ncbi:MAG: hypothetical protein M1831_003500, partial [Alyxoria varia]
RPDITEHKHILPEIETWEGSASFELNGKEMYFVISDCTHQYCGDQIGDSDDSKTLSKRSPFDTAERPRRQAAALSPRKASSSGTALVKRMMLGMQQSDEQPRERLEVLRAPRNHLPSVNEEPHQPHTLLHWTRWESPYPELLGQWIELQRLEPGPKYYMAVQGRNIAQWSPTLFLWLRRGDNQFKTLPAPVTYTIASYSQIHLHYFLSPKLVYKAAENEDLYPDEIDRYLTSTITPKARVWLVLNWGWHTVRDLLNDPRENLFDGDPRIAELREEIIIQAHLEWQNIRRDRIKPMNAAGVREYLPPYERLEVRTELAQRFKDLARGAVTAMWPTLTRDEALAVRDFMQEHRGPFNRLCYEFATELADYGKMVVPRSGVYLKQTFFEVMQGHAFGLEALQSAIENPETPFRVQSNNRFQYSRLDLSKQRPENVRNRGMPPQTPGAPPDSSWVDDEMFKMDIDHDDDQDTSNNNNNEDSNNDGSSPPRA